MNRKIKFRGKDSRTGKWVYGFYCRHDYGAHYQDKKLIKEACSVHDIWTADGWVAVEETSVGQFTGLCDCNGNEIYEGDIVEFCGDLRHVVQFKHGAFGYTLIDGWFVSYCGNSNFTFNPLNKSNYHKVIGNIHDNPELIK